MLDPASQSIAHMVFFTLKDRSASAVGTLVASCHEHLAGHDGVVYFSAGERAPEFDRPVNDDEFDVALHVVFEDRAAHDAYQESPRHLKFLEHNKPTWAKIRVFDSRV